MASDLVAQVESMLGARVLHQRAVAAGYTLALRLDAGFWLPSRAWEDGPLLEATVYSTALGMPQPGSAACSFVIAAASPHSQHRSPPRRRVHVLDLSDLR